MTLTENQYLRKISPSKIATLSTRRIEEIIRQGESLLSVQTDNIRSIDNRAMTLLTATGVILTLMTAFNAGQEVNNKATLFSVFTIILSIIGAIGSAIFCLLIVQSKNFSPIGNNPNELLIDVTVNYSEHEEHLEHALSLSRRITRNEELIKQNGFNFLIASILWVITFASLSINFTLSILL